LLVALLVAVVAVAGGWFAWRMVSAQAQPAGHPERISIDTSTGRHEFTVEWAITPAETQRGLMFREQMAPDHGMVFDFLEDAPRSFWMRNTVLSLDMIFIRADGTVARIARNTIPFTDTPVPSGEPVRYVFEVNAGTSDRIGLVPGDRVNLN
jgi:uncharacterized membrane protein (UPF0127 family)